MNSSDRSIRRYLAAAAAAFVLLAPGLAASNQAIASSRANDAKLWMRVGRTGEDYELFVSKREEIRKTNKALLDGVPRKI